VAAEADDAQPRIAGLEARQLLERVVAAPVGHDDEFVGAPIVTEHLGQLVIQTLDVGRLVVDRDDDRELGSHRARQSGHYISSTCPASTSFRAGWADWPSWWAWPPRPSM